MDMAILTNRRPIDEELAKLKAATHDLPRGSLIKHTEIEGATGLQHHDASGQIKPPWGKLIRKWKQGFLKDCGIQPVSEPGVGYRLPTVEEQMEAGMRLESASGRRLNKAMAVVGMIPVAQLNEDGQRLQTKIVGDIRAMKGLKKELHAERKSLLSRQPVLPRLSANGVTG